LGSSALGGGVIVQAAMTAAIAVVSAMRAIFKREVMAGEAPRIRCTHA
jgi:hypothetical protein